MSASRHRTLLFLTLLALGSVLLFTRLGEGPYRLWDEGLYGAFGRNALLHHNFLHAVDEHGNFPTRWNFSKPPLSLWLVAASFATFGPSLFALRLPFATAAFAVTLLLFAWGCRLQEGKRGSWLGFLAGLVWLLSHGVLRYGRQAAIEPLLIAFVLAALLAHAYAMDDHRRHSLLWACLSGLCVALAFLTKQVVCAVALVPIGLAELARVRREGLRAPALRVSCAFSVPSVVAGVWIFLLSRVESENVSAMLWKHAVYNRVRGYDDDRHHNYLNRVVEVLTRDAPPFSWKAALFGLVLLVACLSRDPRRRHDVWLVGGMFTTAWVAFDLVSRSLLPWYVLTLWPALALGTAFVLIRAADLSRERFEASPLEMFASAVGVWALVEFAVSSASFLPSILVAGGVAVAVTCALTLVAQRARIVLATACFVAVLGACAIFEREAYRFNETSSVAMLGPELHAAGARRVAVEPDLKLPTLSRTTFLGPLAQNSGAPWKLARASDFDAYVQARLVPRELNPRPALRLLRAGGLTALVGDLRTPPYTEGALEQLLARGDLTFEAEDLGTDRYDSLQSDPDASGRAVRTVSRVERKKKISKFVQGRTLELPPGSYRATFFLRAECDDKVKDPAVRVAVAAATKAVKCREATASSGPFAAVTVAFVLSKPQSVDIAVRDVAVPLTLDRVTVRRASSS